MDKGNRVTGLYRVSEGATRPPELFVMGIVVGIYLLVPPRCSCDAARRA